MNQKLVFCIVFLVIFCCDISMSSAAVEKSDFDEINKTLTIYDNESKVMTVRLISAVPDLCTFTEIFEVSNYEVYIPDKDNDFRVRTVSYAGSGVTDVEWFIEQNISHIENVTDYDVIQVEEIVYSNKTGKNETILVNKMVIIGYHDETRYRDVWVNYQPYDKEMQKDSVQRIKVVYYKIPELGYFRIQTIPVFRGVECSELTWWSGSWDRKRPILINNTVGDSVTDYHLISVNLSSYNINAVSARIINETSGTEESFWNETVDISDNLEYVWCNYSSLPNGSWINSTYYIYYQSSPFVSSASDGDATFEFFDDYAGTTIDTSKWDETDVGSHISQNDKLIFDGGTSTWGQTGVATDNTFARPFIYETHYKTNTISNTRSLGIKDATAGVSYSDFVYLMHHDPSGELDILEDGNARSSAVRNYAANTDYWFKVEVFSTGAKYYRSTDGKATWDLMYTSSYSSETPLKIGATSYQGPQELDNTYIRQYTVNEPEPWTVGSEENYTPTPTPTPTPAPTISVSPAQYDELDLPLILYILMISLLYLFVAFRNGVATIELSLIYLIFAFIFLLFQTVTMSVNYIYLTLFLLLFLISIAGITKQGAD